VRKVRLPRVQAYIMLEGGVRTSEDEKKRRIRLNCMGILGRGKKGLLIYNGKSTIRGRQLNNSARRRVLQVGEKNPTA